jgi:hypothetical protein
MSRRSFRCCCGVRPTPQYSPLPQSPGVPPAPAGRPGIPAVPASREIPTLSASGLRLPAPGSPPTPPRRPKRRRYLPYPQLSPARCPALHCATVARAGSCREVSVEAQSGSLYLTSRRDRRCRLSELLRASSLLPFPPAACHPTPHRLAAGRGRTSPPPPAAWNPCGHRSTRSKADKKEASRALQHPCTRYTRYALGL